VPEWLVPTIIAVGIMLLVGFPVHEFMHAWTAHRLGDDTARWQGRLTLDPRVHFDPVGGVMLAISAVISGGSFFFGYAKPTPVNPMNLRGGRRGEALVAVAGPLSNLVMAAAVAIPIRVVLASPELSLDVGTERLASLLLEIGLSLLVINVWLFLFNLIPIPPLDGWRGLLGVVDARLHWQLRDLEMRYAQVIPIVFIAFIIVGGTRVLGPLISAILSFLLGV
jgi:Zn-dependent protease